MNPIERDYSVFGSWPAGAQINAQVLDGSGKLVTSAGALKITWEALADSTGSVNTTSVGKTNFWPFAKALFGGSAEPGVGITGNLMSASGPQQLSFDSALNRFTAPWIPLIRPRLRRFPLPLAGLLHRPTCSSTCDRFEV